jgi:hypothetical protein
MAASIDFLFNREKAFVQGNPKLAKARRSGHRYWRAQFRAADAGNRSAAAVGARHLPRRIGWLLVSWRFRIEFMMLRVADKVRPS